MKKIHDLEQSLLLQLLKKEEEKNILLFINITNPLLNKRKRKKKYKPTYV